MKVQTKRYDKNRKKNKWAVFVVILAACFFLLAAFAINSEIRSIYSELSAQRKQLNDAIDKTVTAYMETKYMGTSNGNQLSEGSLENTELTEEEINNIVAAVMSVVNENLTDDIFTGASQLAVDKLRAQIAKAVQDQILALNLSSKTLTDEITALVLKGIEGNLADYQAQITSNSENVLNISNTVAGTSTKIENLDASINNLQKGYDSSIAALQKTDAVLASRIDSILKESSSSSQSFEKQVADLLSQIKNINSSVTNTNTDINNRYNNITQQIANSEYKQANITDDLQNQINTLQSALDQYIREGALAGTITPRTDGGSGNKLTLIVP